MKRNKYEFPVLSFGTLMAKRLEEVVDNHRGGE